MYFKFALITLGVLIVLMVYRILFRSPTVFYKIQSINAFTSLCVLFLMVYVYFLKQPGFIDLAFIYIVINYIGIVTVLKYIQAIYNDQDKKL